MADGDAMTLLFTEPDLPEGIDPHRRDNEPKRLQHAPSCWERVAVSRHVAQVPEPLVHGGDIDTPSVQSQVAKEPLILVLWGEAVTPANELLNGTNRQHDSGVRTGSTRHDPVEDTHSVTPLGMDAEPPLEDLRLVTCDVPLVHEHVSPSL